VDELLKLAAKAVEIAIELGAEQADAYVSASHGISVSVENNSVASCRSIEDQGMSIRAYKKGALGFTYTQRLTENAPRRLAETAVRLAGAAEPDPDFVSLPLPEDEPTVRGLWDDAVAGLTIEESVGWVTAAVEEARALEPDISIAGGVGVGWGEHAVANSLGVEREGHSTSASLYAHGSIREGDEVGSYWEFTRARRLSEFVPQGIGEVVAREARRMLAKRPIESATLPIILGPLAASSIPGSVAMLAQAEAVQRNRSILAGRKGDKIGSEVLTIIDEPLREGGMSSGPHDGEGAARRDLPLVTEGKLATYLHNSYTANKGHEPNTAHGSRSGYRSTVGISSTNLNLRRGDMLSDELIRETRRGVYMPHASVHPNSVTGDVSETIDVGLMIEDGEITFPIKNSMLGGSFLDFLKNVDVVTKDYRAEPGLELPTVRIQGVRIAGAG